MQPLINRRLKVAILRGKFILKAVSKYRSIEGNLLFYSVILLPFPLKHDDQ